MNASVDRPDTRGHTPPQIAGVLTLVQALTRLVQSESPADLFAHAFSTLSTTVPFDLGVAVMLEQNLDLYISAREDAGRQVSEDLVQRVRHVLQSIIPAEFTDAEVVVKDERRSLPRTASPAGLTYDVHSVLTQESRTAGVVLVCRSEPPFTDDERRVVDIFSAQLSMLLDNLRARAKILSLADMDDLTGIPNRRFFRRRLSEEMERARVYNVPLSVVLIDVDDFKQINDTYGHVMGDVVLSELCGSLKQMLRSPDTISRFGGDEFALILPHTDAAGASAVADRVLQHVASFAMAAEDGRSIRCTVSIGIAQSQDDDTTFSDVVRRADACLYDAKRQGKNRYNL